MQKEGFRNICSQRTGFCNVKWCWWSFVCQSLLLTRHFLWLNPRFDSTLLLYNWFIWLDTFVGTFVWLIASIEKVWNSCQHAPNCNEHGCLIFSESLFVCGLFLGSTVSLFAEINCIFRWVCEMQLNVAVQLDVVFFLVRFCYWTKLLFCVVPFAVNYCCCRGTKHQLIKVSVHECNVHIACCCLFARFQFLNKSISFGSPSVFLSQWILSLWLLPVCIGDKLHLQRLGYMNATFGCMHICSDFTLLCSLQTVYCCGLLMIARAQWDCNTMLFVLQFVLFCVFTFCCLFSCFFIKLFCIYYCNRSLQPHSLSRWAVPQPLNQMQTLLIRCISENKWTGTSAINILASPVLDCWD